MRTYEDEKEYFRRGAEHFGYDYDKLPNKRKYKEVTTLNCAIWNFRKRSKIIVVTKCVVSDKYLDALFKRPMVGFDIYFNECRIPEYNYTAPIMEEVAFKRIKVSLNDFLEGYGTVVLIGKDTIIYDYKEFGVYHNYNYNGKHDTYRVKDKKLYEKKYSDLMHIIEMSNKPKNG